MVGDLVYVASKVLDEKGECVLDENGECVLEFRCKRIVLEDFRLWSDQHWTESDFDKFLKPIPLNVETLVKNDFQWGHTSDQEDFASCVGCGLPEPAWTYDEGGGSVQVVFPNETDGGEIILSDQSFDRDVHIVFCGEIFLHELQHAFKLCRINKEIEL